jgi:Mor family transcriptional regulator
MAFYGGIQLYIPLERTGFKKDIANEIYEKYDGTNESMSELCRNYNLSFAQVYRCVHNARETKMRERERKNQKELFS